MNNKSNIQQDELNNKNQEINLNQNLRRIHIPSKTPSQEGKEVTACHI